MFAKLKQNFIIDEKKCLIGQELVNYGHEINNEFKGIWYLQIEGTPLDNLIKVVPERYRKNFNFSLMKINTSIKAHTDNGILSSINFYIRPQDCLTQFYRVKSVDVKSHITPSTSKNYLPSNGRAFEKNDLIETNSFIAKPNEAWLLDVTNPHSVESPDQIEERVAITMVSLIYDYKMVYKMLQETGYL